MELAKMEVSRAEIRKVHRGKLTSGMVGAEVAFSFDDAWDGLNRIAVFKAGGTVKDVLLVGESCVIPHEVLERPVHLVVGVYGTDADGSVVIPTVWADLGMVEQGAKPSGEISKKPTPEVWAQILGMIGDLKKLNTEDKSSLVAAINEVLRNGADPDEIERIVEEYLEDNGPRNALPAPDTAEVGQYFRVSAVDENGKITAVEAVEAPGGGTEDYTALKNKPKINGVELSGNKTSADLGIGDPTDEQVSNAVNAYLEANPDSITAVQDGSITPNKTSFLRQYTQNLYNPAENVTGQLSSDGTVDTSNTDFYVTGFIPATKAVYNYTVRPWYYALYDENKTFVSKSVATTPLDLTAVSGEFAYIRLQLFIRSYNEEYMFVQGELPSQYVAYDDPDNTKTDITDDTVKRAVGQTAYEYTREAGISDMINLHSLPVDKIDAFDRHMVNLLDFSKAVSGSHIDTDGAVKSTTDGAMVSDFIPVVEGKTYYFSGDGYMVNFVSGLYDANKKFIQTFTSSTKSYTIPEDIGAAYMRIAQVTETSVVSDEIPRNTWVPPTPSFRMKDIYAVKDVRAHLMGTYGVRICAVGDSITQGYASGGMCYGDMLNRDWSYAVTNNGIAGTKLNSSAGDDSGMCERLKTYNPDDFDIVFVMGGTNDRSDTLGTMGDTDTTTVYGALKDICNTLLTMYHGKKIGLITTLKYEQGQEWDVNTASREVGSAYGIPVLDLERELIPLCYNDDIKGVYTSDGLHPSIAGHELIARKISAWLLTL